MKRIDKYSLDELKHKFISDDGEANFSQINEFVNYCNEEIKNEEIKVVPRVATINTAEGLFKAEQERYALCKSNPCDTCRFYSQRHRCFTMYLAEEIEVEE